MALRLGVVWLRRSREGPSELSNQILRATKARTVIEGPKLPSHDPVRPGVATSPLSPACPPPCPPSRPKPLWQSLARAAEAAWDCLRPLEPKLLRKTLAGWAETRPAPSPRRPKPLWLAFPVRAEAPLGQFPSEAEAPLVLHPHPSRSPSGSAAHQGRSLSGSESPSRRWPKPMPFWW